MRVAVAFSIVVGVISCANRAKTSVSLYEAGDYAGAAKAADAGLASHPGDSGLWQMRVRAALALGDAEGVAKAYASYRGHRDGEDDHDLLKDLAIATLSQALGSPSAKLKIAAIEAVQAAEIHALADQVMERMDDDDDRVVASAATAVLRGHEAAPRVASSMLRSDDPEARRIAVDGIGKKIGALAIVDLHKLAGNDPDPRVRRAAIRWVGQIKHKDSVEMLERQLRHPDEGVRAAAAVALAKIGDGDLAALAQKVLADKSLAVRLAGLELLVAAKRMEDVARLAEDPEPMVAAEAAILVKRPELAARALERAASSPSWNVRAGAINLAVRALGKDGAVAFASKLLGDPEARVRIAAARVVARHGDRSAALPVLAAAMTGDTELSAASDLADLGDRRGLDTLDRLVRDQKLSPDARAAAAAAHRGAHRITPGLVAALADPNGVVRVEAATVIVLTAR